MLVSGKTFAPSFTPTEPTSTPPGRARSTSTTFISASRASRESGAFIMHRAHGTSVDLLDDRAICKMKATITQRFSLDGVEVDAESDCRFCFFFEQHAARDGSRGWGARLVRHWYEKDKLIPVDPRKEPELDEELLKTFLWGYLYLDYCQAVTMKAKSGNAKLKVKRDMPGHTGPEHDRLLHAAKVWLMEVCLMISSEHASASLIEKSSVH